MENDRNNFAIFIDLENAGGKVSTLTSVIEKVKIKGNILLGKVYGYSEQYADLKELLLSNTFYPIPSLKYGFNQKNNLDIQLVIDALEVAFTNERIDCFCIVSGDSDFTPLVGKLKSMGKFVLGISRSEVASNIFINACNEFIFLESVSGRTETATQTGDKEDDSLMELNSTFTKIIGEQAEPDGWLYVSELKKTLLRLKPDFHEKNYGQSSFGKLLLHLESRFHQFQLQTDNNTLRVRLSVDSTKPIKQITRANWIEIVQGYLDEFKGNGFVRVNPSIIKAAIHNDYPGFEEKQIGYKKFSELMKRLEKEKRVKVEMDEAKNMLLTIL